MRAIDADALISAVIEETKYDGRLGLVSGKTIVDLINNAPNYKLECDMKLKKVADLLDGTTDPFDLEDAIDLLHEIKWGINASTIVEPQMPEWAMTVKRWYNKALCMSYIQNPLAWALYQTWKEYDSGERREDESD